MGNCLFFFAAAVTAYSFYFFSFQGDIIKCEVVGIFFVQWVQYNKTSEISPVSGLT